MADMLLNNPERQLGGVEFILRRAAELYPNRVAIDDRSNGRSLTYRELQSRAIRLARGLEEIGIRKGDVVASAFRNEASAIEIVFACAFIGAVNAPLNTRLASSEAQQFIDRQRAVAFVGHSDFQSFVVDQSLLKTVLFHSDPSGVGALGYHDYETLILRQSDRTFAPRAEWSDPYMIGMTGGTTGGSKGAVWSHGGCLLEMLSTVAHWSIKPGYKALCCAPAYHAAGLSSACMPILWQAGTIIFPVASSFDPKWFLRVVAEESIDCFFLVPAMVQPLYQHWDGAPLQSVKSIAIASAPVPKPLRVKVSEMFPSADKLVFYGMTECLSISMQDPRDFLEHGESVGQAALVARLRIVDDNGHEVPRGTSGHVVARTMGQSLYYNHDPDSTSGTFRSCVNDSEGLEWVYTGDIGVLLEDGRLTLLDRAKDIIISGGENVASSEVESVIAFHPKVRECAVIGVVDEKWGERVCAVIVSSANEANPKGLAGELYASCRANLGPYKIPKQFVFVDALPRNAFGKVLKRELRARSYEISFDADKLRAISGEDLVVNPERG
jgi:fatty-acyl-CoA synthase